MTNPRDYAIIRGPLHETWEGPCKCGGYAMIFKQGTTGYGAMCLFCFASPEVVQCSSVARGEKASIDEWGKMQCRS